MYLSQRRSPTDHLPYMKRFSRRSLFSCCLALLFQAGHATELENASIPFGGMTGDSDSPSERPLGQLVLVEKLGINHPDQVVDFDYSTNNLPFYVTEADGTVIQHQTLVGGRLALRQRGGLRANETHRFRIVSGVAPSEPADDAESVRVVESIDHYEIANTLVAIRVPKGISPTLAVAPIQALRLRDGIWAGAETSGSAITDLAGEPLRVSDMHISFLERGPLVVTVEVAYHASRPALVYGGSVLVAAGAGFYRATITLQAGQPSVLLEEDTDMDVRWTLDLGTALKPDQARYQGHHATSVGNGFESDGRQYRPTHERGANMDALVNLPLNGPSPYGRFLTRWDPWAFDTGWYWQFYNKDAPASADLLAIFQGRASRILGAHFSGVVVQSSVPGELRLVSQFSRRGPDARVFSRNRFSWGLFSGTKNDLREPTAVQVVGHQMNLHAGFNLNKIHRYVLDVSAEPAEANGLYLDREALVKMIQKIRAPYFHSYYNHLYSDEPTLRPLWDAWADPSGRKARTLAAAVIARSRDLAGSLVNGQGIYSFQYHYWMGGLAMSRDAALIAHLLAYSVYEPTQLPPDTRAQLRSVAALYGYMLWDDDFVPLFEHGQNLGTPNMPIQQISYRDLLVLMMPNHPALAPKLAGVRAREAELLKKSINEQGAALGSNHYLGASMGPVVNAMQQQKRGAGPEEDPFRTQARLTKFSEYLLHLLTPPEPRFGGRRKTVSFGDGSTEATPLYGQLATGFREVNDALSERLMGAWRQQGAPHSGFFGSSVLQISEALPDRSPMLGDADFPGALTVLRHGFGTADETAAWLINGDFYRDHYHCDFGAVMLYALGSPISVHWGSFYEPRQPGAWMQNVMVPESALSAPWYSGDVSTDECLGNRGQIISGAGLKVDSRSARAAVRLDNKGSFWNRRVWDYRSDPAAPVLRIRDEFTGIGAADSKIFSLTLMATGPVQTETGPCEVPLSSAPAKPPAGVPFALAPGLIRLGFQGQWGVDFDLFIVAESSQQATVTGWKHFWHPTREADEYKQATGKKFEEAQYILRLRGTGPFDVVIVPYRRGRRPPDLVITRTSDGVLSLLRDGKTTTLAD
jgi:hypothetical protein